MLWETVMCLPMPETQIASKFWMTVYIVSGLASVIVGIAIGSVSLVVCSLLPRAHRNGYDLYAHSKWRRDGHHR